MVNNLYNWLRKGENFTFDHFSTIFSELQEKDSNGRSYCYGWILAQKERSKKALVFHRFSTGEFLLLFLSVQKNYSCYEIYQ